MKRRRGDFEVFSMSAIDLFASAMGAFVIIAIVLMPDYRKEVMAEGDNMLLEKLKADSEDALEEADNRRSEAQANLSFAQQQLDKLMSQAEMLRNELAEATEQSIADYDPPKIPEPELDSSPHDKVSFRFLGLKTSKQKFLFVVDLGKFMGVHKDLIRKTLTRALDSLRDHHDFAIMAYTQNDSGPVYYSWPPGGDLTSASAANQTEAINFLKSLDNKYSGSPPTLFALERALDSEAEAVVLLSDGLPNPKFNDYLDSMGIVNRIATANGNRKEVHAVALGDYFKYRSTVEFMETLAKANNGDFMALSQ